MNSARFFVLAIALSGCSFFAKTGQGSAQPATTSTVSSGSAESSQATQEAFPPGNWSFAERSTWQQIYEDRAQQLNLMNSTCGTNIEMSFDHAAFRDRLTAVDANRNEDWGASDRINAIRNVCLEGDAGKQAVAASIQRIYFIRSNSAHALGQGQLTIALDLEANPRAYSNEFSEWLRSSL